MNPIPFFVCLVLFLIQSTLGLNAQNPLVDSLRTQLELHLQKDTSRVILLNELADQVYRSDYKQCLTYLNEAEDMAISIGYKKGLAETYLIKGIAVNRYSDYKDGVQYYEKAAALFQELELHGKVITCYGNTAIFHRRRGELRTAIKYREKSIALREKVGSNKNGSCLLYTSPSPRDA